MTTERRLSTRDKRVQQHVGFTYPDEGTPESPEELASRQARNLSEWKLARSAAEKQGNAAGVKTLDAERMRGMGTDFPHDDTYVGAQPMALEATDDLGFVPDEDLGFVPDHHLGFAADTASQADVRKAEPAIPMEEQSADERGFNAALKAWLTTPAGQPFRFYPYNDPIKQRAEFTRRTGRVDPATDTARNAAKVEHAANTGEVVYEDSAAYNLGKPLAGMAGFALGGPAGATAGEMGVRYLTLTANLDRAVKAGAIDEDRAAEVLAKEMFFGTATDAAWNTLLPAIGILAKKVPGASWLGDKLKDALVKLGASPSTTQTLRDAKIESRAGKTEDLSRRTAVRELSRRMPEDFVPSPGQVTGKPSGLEGTINKAFPNEFIAQEKAMQGAAEGMRHDALYPSVQPEAKALGNRIVNVAEDYEKKVKARLRPVFDEADQLGVAVNMTSTVDVAKAALAADKKVLGGNISSAEREYLKSIVTDATRMRTNGLVMPEAALDFISSQKEKLRSLNQDGVPTKAFEVTVGKLTSTADDAYSVAARSINRGDLVTKLENARKDYRTMMESVYSGSVKQALKVNPEDVGRKFWQSGNVTEIEQLHKLLTQSTKEGSISKTVADKTREDVTRGFLQEAVPNVEAAAKWSKSLAEDPKRMRTWAALTAGPEGKLLNDTMKVLENAAQMAVSRDSSKVTKLPFAIPIGRAAQGGLGLSLVTGTVNPALMTVGLTVASVMNMMATAAVRGDKGTLNLITKVLRLRDASTGGAVQALRAATGELAAKAKDYGVEVFEEIAEEKQ